MLVTGKNVFRYCPMSLEGKITPLLRVTALESLSLIGLQEERSRAGGAQQRHEFWQRSTCRPGRVKLTSAEVSHMDHC